MTVGDSEGNYEALRQAIATLRVQLGLLPLDDPRRDSLYQDLIWCYKEAFALLWRRIEACRAALPTTTASRDR
jgi:hypothetical protein